MTGQMGDTARRLSTAFFALALLIAALPGTSWTAPIDPDLAAGDYALVQVAHGTAGAIAAKATAAGATDVAALDNLDIVTARVSAEALRSLQSDWRVSFLATDVVVSAAGGFSADVKPSAGVAAIDAPQAWGSSTGRGITVALMDTGVAAHPDLAGSVLARVDFVGDGALQLDPAGHGTFVAGLIAAHGSSFKGVAPDAKLVSLRVLDANGNGSLHAVLAAFDWLLQNRVAYRIKVLNLSFGARQVSSYQQDLLAAVVESAWFAGVTVVAAAGNRGPLPGTVATPGADPFILTTGSFDDQGTAGTGDDRESLFSGRGPTLDGFVKPDVLAPGEHVVSLRASDDPTVSGYTRMTGTSVSNAMAAGVAALVLQLHASYTPTQVKGAIVAGSRKVWGSKTPGLLADNPLWASPAPVNANLVPSSLLLRFLAASGADVGSGGMSWEGISWEGISWEGLSWEAISWEGISWSSLSWESVSKEEVR
jgi:serine protease AprX